MFGNVRFLVIYLLCGLGGSAASLLWHPYVVSAGASGAVFGIAGALGTFVYLGRVHLPEKAARELLTSIAFFIGVNLLFGFSFPGIDNAGHLGGLVVGALLGVAAHYSAFFYLTASGVVAAMIGLAPVAERIASEHPEVILINALNDLETNHPDKAIERMEQTVSRKPDFVRGLELLASLYAETGRLEDAVATARRAVDLDPQSEAAQRVLARALHLSGDCESAVEELEIAVRMTPEDLMSHALLSRSLMECGRQEEAIAALDEAFTWDPDSAFLHQELGLARFATGELDLAVEALRKAIETAPDDPEGYNRLALVLARAGEPDDALDNIKTALDKRPDAPHLLDSLGTVHWYRGEYEQAIEAYGRAISIDPANAIYHYNLSVSFERHGDVARASREREEALALNPDLEMPNDGTPLI